MSVENRSEAAKKEKKNKYIRVEQEVDQRGQPEVGERRS
jgi:hypothetical protein